MKRTAPTCASRTPRTAPRKSSSPAAAGFGPITAVMSVALSLVCLLAAAGCSSAPKPKPGSTEIKEQASEFTASGNRFFAQARFEEALRYYELALTENISVLNEEGIAEIYNAIGMTKRAQGDPQDAELRFRDAYATAERIGNGPLMARSMSNLAQLSLERGESRSALDQFIRALELVNEKTDAETVAIIRHNMGMAYKNLGEHAKALESIEAALAINTKLKRYAEIGSNYYAVSSIYSKLGNYGKANEFAAKALENDRLAENTLGIAQDLYAIGLIAHKEGRLSAAYDSFNQARMVYASVALAEGVVKCLKALVETSRALGRADDAERWAGELERLSGGSAGNGTAATDRGEQ